MVLLGLNALARVPPAKLLFADGHRCASMILAHLMCQDSDPDDITTARIVELFDCAKSIQTEWRRETIFWFGIFGFGAFQLDRALTQ